MEWWLVIGFLGQALFFMRFVVQWIVSEKSGRSVVPEVFWYFSLGGGLILFVYAVHRHDPVFMLGQGVGLFVYIRNIMLVHRHKQTRAASPTDIEPE
ncbi:MAG: lipid-A-disaccharide synthase N-terminal domain-containing protein [Rhodospirillales bacterium]|nr:lipid-A-disaccharide synthase N-terminal domain-containing protein [Alphaproteobacteria bacterium]MCB9986528.1 lipid-A-disaccharide synthase N-terminal domain-containing protein [Rhodospirillales bacterium]USO08604.1 MAG: lipid-A-disaccharide synthase N-terminal domain-containing protein [Rhodospirillales bacterium]